MRVACYFMSDPNIARFTFATKWCFSDSNPNLRVECFTILPFFCVFKGRPKKIDFIGLKSFFFQNRFHPSLEQGKRKRKKILPNL